MKITACPRCGSKKIFQGKLKEGILTGYTPTKYVCRNCGYQGSPLIFDKESEYKKFVSEIEDEDIKTDEEEISENDKKIMDDLKNIAEETEHYDEDRKILKSTASRLGVCLIVAGILITSVSLGMYLYQTGVLIIDGIILLAVGLIFSDEEKIKTNKYPRIAGSIFIITGAFFFLLFVMLLFFALNIDMFAIDERSTLLPVQGALINITIVIIIFSIIEIIGGIFSISKKRWEIAMLAGIIGTIIFPPLSTIPSLIGLILITYSRKAFKTNKSI